jgi:hypothetical protein
MDEVCYLHVSDEDNMQFPNTAAPGFDARSGHVKFLVDKIALEQDLSEFFGFPCQLSFHQPLYIH